MKKSGSFYIIILVVFASICWSCAKGPGSDQPPNIVLIYADDLGIGLLGHEGQEIISTPVIDKLASEGLRFNNAYSCMLCAPARASLISGLHDCHADRFEITNAGIYKKISTENYLPEEIEEKINSNLSPVPDNMVFLGEVAKDAGYVTGQFGKLEWGFATTQKQMKRHGWDHYLGYFDHGRAHGFYPPFLFDENGIRYFEGNTLVNCGKSIEREDLLSYEERWDMNGKVHYSPDIFIEAALDFIESNRESPFFLYFPTQLPHGPVSIPEVNSKYIDNPDLTQIEKEYASMVSLLDHNTGQITDKLEEMGLTDNTVVIFMADNGHEIYYTKEGRILKPYTDMRTGVQFDNLTNKYYSEYAGDVFDGNGGRAGMKRSNLQGGLNVPLIVKWPALIKKGRVSTRLTAAYDLLSTLADITGYDGELITDGRSFYNELTAESSEEGHDFVVFSSYTGPALITSEGWKIRTFLSKDVFELYYLPDDFREMNNLADEYPDKLSELKDKLLEACEGDYNNGLYSYQLSQMRIE